MNASEFYRLRDDRTNLCGVEPRYAQRRVAITIDDAAASDVAGQIAFLLVVNLTARWCRSIAIGSPHRRLLSALKCWASEELLAVAAVQVARRADPFGDFRARDTSGNDWIRLHVGSAAPPDAFRIGAEGWIALGGNAVSAAQRCGRPLAAAMAACLGAAWAFRAAIDDRALPTSVRISLWNLLAGDLAELGDGVPDIDIGTMLMIGCGAIGSALAYLLPIAAVKTNVVTVDGDDADVTNLNRSPMLAFEDLKTNKAIATARFLRSAGVPAREVPMWFNEALAQQQILMERPDIVVPAANERHVRHAIQHQVPPLMVYGTTSRDWQAFLGRHIPLREDCLACRFPQRERASAPPLRCATGTIATAQAATVSVDAALPFVSTTAAVIALAEMVKLAATGMPQNPNFACIDLRGGLDTVLRDQREAVAGCICAPHRSAWHALNRTSRFRALTDR